LSARARGFSGKETLRAPQFLGDDFRPLRGRPVSGEEDAAARMAIFFSPPRWTALFRGRAATACFLASMAVAPLLAQPPTRETQKQPAPEALQPPAAPAGPPIVAVPWTTTPPTLDGILSPGEWDGAAQVNLSPSWPKDQAPKRLGDDVSAFRLMWDADCLYIALASLLPPPTEQARLVDVLYKNPKAPRDGELIETYRLVWDTRPPDRPGEPPAIPGAFQARVFLGWTPPGAAEAPLLFETRAGYVPSNVAKDLPEARRSWSPDIAVAGSASPGALVEMAIPFVQLNSLYGLISRAGGVPRDRGIERFAPPAPGEVWRLMIERRLSGEHWSAWGKSLKPFDMDRGGQPGEGAIRFEGPPETAASDRERLETIRRPLPSGRFLRNYREAARRAQAENKLLVLFYAVEALAASPESTEFWSDPAISDLEEIAVFAWLNPYDLPETAPRHGVQLPLEIVVLTPSGRLAQRWRSLPTIEALYDALAKLAQRHLRPE
jgi:hypothetical protein